MSEQPNSDISITVAICSYNGADRLPILINALRALHCPISAEILVVDNNSTDNTKPIATSLASEEGMPLRYAFEPRQGITYARNRAIEAAKGNEYLAFIDVDELPGPNWLASAVDALRSEQADCVGGAIKVKYPENRPPAWLTEELSGFLGQLNYGNTPFWIKDKTTPVWSGNIAYRTMVFSNGLRFDDRYNRQGKGVGGGEDAMMFRSLVDRRYRIRYRPDMVIEHLIEPDKLSRKYFLKLHYVAGTKYGEFEMPDYARSLLGIPPFMLIHLIKHVYRYLKMMFLCDENSLRQAMNASYALGVLVGRIRR